MKIRKTISIVLIWALCVMGLTLQVVSLSGCSKQEEVSSVVEDIPDFYEAYEIIPQENATKSAGNLAVYVGQCIINDDFNAFKQVLKLDECLLKAEDIWEEFKTKVGNVSSFAAVYSVDSEDNTLIVKVAEKIEEYFAKDENGEPMGNKLGDIVGNFTEIRFKFEKIDDNYYIQTSDLVDIKPIKVKLPEGSILKIDGIVIDESYRDKDGYFVVKGFRKSDPVHIVVDTNIMQGIEFDLALSEVVGYDSNNNPKYKATDRVFSPICYLDLNTKTEALSMMKEALQAVMTSIENKEDIKKASCLKYFASNANLDDIALRWQTGIKAVHNTKNYAFSDLILLDIYDYTDADLKGAKQKQNTIVTTDNALMTIGVKVSFTRYNKYNNTLSEGTLASLNTSYVPITFTIEDGVYKIVNIGEAFFNGLVKKG